MILRGGPGLLAAAHLIRLGAGAPPDVLRRGGMATAIGLAALRSPDRAVLVREHDSLTGRQLDAALASTADALAQRWPAGSRIAVTGDGGIGFVVVLAAAGIAGLRAVAVGPRAVVPPGVESVDAWEVFVRGFETRPLRGRSSASSSASSVRPLRGRSSASSVRPLRGGPSAGSGSSAGLELLSTGTTGEPRTTVRGRIGLRGMLQLADADRRLRLPDGAMLVLAPPDHGHGLTMVLAGLVRGRTVVLGSGLRPAEQAEAAARHRVRTITGVPAQLARLDDSVFEGVELIVSGSSLLVPALRARLEATGARVVDGYGSTETGTVAVDGRPLAGVTIQVDATSRILITSPLGGVARDPGDLGRVERGRLVVTGRTGDLVDSGGELLAPSRIEEELHRIPGVLSARVSTVDDELLGTRLTADVLVGDPAIDAAALGRELGERLGRASVPRSIVVSRE